jgi:hypothetical protein
MDGIYTLTTLQYSDAVDNLHRAWELRQLGIKDVLVRFQRLNQRMVGYQFWWQYPFPAPVMRQPLWMFVSAATEALRSYPHVNTDFAREFRRVKRMFHLYGDQREYLALEHTYFGGWRVRARRVSEYELQLKVRRFSAYAMDEPNEGYAASSA